MKIFETKRKNINSTKLCLSLEMKLYETTELQDGRIRLGYEYWCI